VNFRNTIILMTSNVGSDTIKRGSSLGFSPITDENSYEKMREKILDESKRVFRPEFLNRLDDIIVFDALTSDELASIVDLQVERLASRLAGRRLVLTVTPAAREWLSVTGFDPVYGARPLRRLIQSAVGDQLARALLDGSISDGDTVVVEVDPALLAGKEADGLTVRRGGA